VCWKIRSQLLCRLARKHGLAKSLLFRWRKAAGLTAKRRSIAPFVPVRIAAAPTINLPSSEPLATPESGSVHIELVDGTKLRVNGVVKLEVLKHVMAALRGSAADEQAAPRAREKQHHINDSGSGLCQGMPCQRSHGYAQGLCGISDAGAGDLEA
jgi:transposase-like protein